MRLLVIASILLGVSPHYDARVGPFGDGPHYDAPPSAANILFDFHPGANASAASLSDDLCFGGIDCTAAEVVCNGDDAGASAWSCDTGGSFAKVENGTDFTTGAGSPLLGLSDDSVLFNVGDYYRASSSTVGDIGGESGAVEIVFKTAQNGGSPRVISKIASGAGWDVKLDGAGLIRMTVSDGTDTRQPSCGSTSFIENQWNHVMLFWDTSIATTDGFTCVVNGVVKGSGLDISAVDSMANSDLLSIGANPSGSFGYLGEVAHFKVWDGVPTRTSAQRVAEAKARFQRGLGVYTDDTGAPTSFGRGISAYIDKYEGATRKLYNVGAHWIRSARRKDGNGATVDGLLFEGLISGTLISNLLLRSDAADNASWTKVNSAVTADTQTTPEGYAHADSIIGSAVEGEHGITQAATITASRYVLSVMSKPGDVDWLYLEDSTLTNAYAYFDLSSCAVGTTGAGIVQAQVDGDWLQGFCRASIQFVGTAAAHTMRILSAEGDGDKSFTGDASTANTYVWAMQLENEDYPTSIIRTEGSTVARSAEQLRYSGSVINPSAGSLVCSGLSPDIEPIFGGDLYTDQLFLTAERGTVQDKFQLRNENTYDKLNWSAWYNTVRDIDIKPNFPGHTAGSSLTDNIRHTLAVDWQLGPHHMWFDGVETDDSPQSDNEIATSFDYIEMGAPQLLVERCTIYDSVGVSDFR